MNNFTNKQNEIPIEFKKVAKEFINGRFQDRIGLVIFSGESYSRCPLTTDYILLNEYVDEISFDFCGLPKLIII